MVFLWVILYGVSYIFVPAMESVFPGQNGYILMILYAGALVIWIGKTNQFKTIHVYKIDGQWKKEWFCLLPVLLLPAYNLLTVRTISSSALLMLSVSIIEEIFFRGFLLQWSMKWGCFRGILIASIFFAIAHMVNIFSGYGIGITFLQCLCAFVIGGVFCIIVIRYQSLLPCIVAHFLVNMTGNQKQLESLEVIGLCLCMVIYIFYGRWLYKKLVCNRERI